MFGFPFDECVIYWTTYKLQGIVAQYTCRNTLNSRETVLIFSEANTDVTVFSFIF